MKLITYLLLLTAALLTGCSSITVLRTAELNRVRDEIDSSNTAHITVMQSKIDSLILLVVTMQEGMNAFTEDSKKMMRNDRLSLNSSLDRLDRQLSYFEAKLESSEHQLKNINTKMGSLENTSGPAGAETVADTSTNDASIKSKELFELAMKDYHNQQYGLSMEEFKELIGKYPKSVYIDKSLYHVGVTGQALKKYDEAIRYYDTLISDFADGAYARSAYVKKGEILVAQDKNEDALAVYEEVLKKYPKSPEAAIAEEKIKTLKK